MVCGVVWCGGGDVVMWCGSTFQLFSHTGGIQREAYVLGLDFAIRIVHV